MNEQLPLTPERLWFERARGWLLVCKHDPRIWRLLSPDGKRGLDELFEAEPSQYPDGWPKVAA